MNLPTDLEFQLNYKRKLTSRIGSVMGPNTVGDRLVVTGQVYDPNTELTTLYLDIYRPEPQNEDAD